MKKRSILILLVAMLMMPSVAWAQKSYYDLAVEAYQAGDDLACMENINKQCETDCNFQTLWLMMKLTYRAGYYEYSASIAASLLPRLAKDDHADRMEAYTIIGVGLFESGEPKMAIKYFNKAIKEDATVAWPFLERGQCYASMGNAKKARKDLNKAIELDSTEYNAILTLAYLAEADKDYASAERYFQRAINATDRKSERVFAEYASSMAVWGDSVRAVDTLLYAFKQDPENGRCGRVYNRFLKVCPNHLLEGLKKKAGEEPYDAQWAALLADCYEEAGQQDSAYRYLYISCLLDPTFAGGVYPTRRLAEALQEAEDFETSKRLLQAAWERKPTSQSWLYAMVSDAQLARDNQSVVAYLNMLETMVDDKDAQIELWTARGGQNYFYLDDIDAAQQDFLSVLKEEADNKYANLMMGMIFDKRGKHAEALFNYNQVIRFSDEFYDFEKDKPIGIDDDTQYLLGPDELVRALYSADKLDKARELVEIRNQKVKNVLVEHPDYEMDADILYNQACMCSIVGMLPEAMEMLDLAVKYGFKGALFIEGDSDFDNVRGTDDASVRMKYDEIIARLSQESAEKRAQIHGIIDGITIESLDK